MRRIFFRVALAVAFVGVAAGCNRRVFHVVQQNCDSTIPVDYEVPQRKAADILIVVDNSGSMSEEQARLRDNFFNLDATQCPLTNLAHIQPEYENPAPALYEGDGPLAKCGFIQLLAAFDNDFRVGVVTTDVGLFDNRAQNAPAGWGAHPQRGCLQPDAAGRKVIARADVSDDDAGNDDLAHRFADVLANIQIYGSPYERGLDAMHVFLDAQSTRAPGCEDDLATFRRDDAALSVIFLSDENDCSRILEDTAPFDELASEPQTPGAFQLAAQVANGGPDRCYTDIDKLAPPSKYAAFLKSVAKDAKVITIAGMVPDASSSSGFDAEGCREGDPPSSTCFASHGNSNLTENGEVCGPDAVAARGGVACCSADSGSRYLDFASAFQSQDAKDFLADSICSDRFRDTMVQAAAFIGSQRSVDLVEPPSDGIIEVEINGKQLSEVEDDTCTSTPTAGFALEGDRRVVFCNGSIPGPGDRVSIRAKGEVATAECGAQP